MERRNAFKCVTQKDIKMKAKNLFEEIASSSGKSFSASNGWCYNFMKRYNLSTRQKTHQSQRLPEVLCPKVVSFFNYLRMYFAKYNILPGQVTAMDETCVFLENISNRTVSVAGKIFFITQCKNFHILNIIIHTF